MLVLPPICCCNDASSVCQSKLHLTGVCVCVQPLTWYINPISNKMPFKLYREWNARGIPFSIKYEHDRKKFIASICCFYKRCDDSVLRATFQEKNCQNPWDILYMDVAHMCATHSICSGVRCALYGANGAHIHCCFPHHLHLLLLLLLFWLVWTVIHSSPSSHLQSTVVTIIAQQFQIWQHMKLCCHLKLLHRIDLDANSIKLFKCSLDVVMLAFLPFCLEHDAHTHTHNSLHSAKWTIKYVQV